MIVFLGTGGPAVRRKNADGVVFLGTKGPRNLALTGGPIIGANEFTFNSSSDSAATYDVYAYQENGADVSDVVLVGSYTVAASGLTNLRQGANTPTVVYQGANTVDKIYQGSNLLWG